MDLMNEIIPIGELFKAGKYKESLLELEILWEKLPEPKELVKNSYMIVSYGAIISQKKSDLEKAWIWALRASPYSKKFNLGGESEFLVGEVAFARGDLETAKKYFELANKISGRRLFKGKNPKFEELLQ